ncbi:MAG: transposase [Firmicutes bacterium]|nr:transposase [Bacillota bacterium]
MISLAKYSLIYVKDNSSICYIKSEEDSICPVCGSPDLKVIGSRKRRAWQGDGERMILVVRRLRCLNCRKIHHELPDILVPYKRYTSAAIEAIIDDNTTEICCENSSIYRIKNWFTEAEAYIAGCLSAIAFRLGLETKFRTGPARKRIKDMMGEATGWLARTVRTIVNTNNWLHTRSAFMS